MGRRWIGRQPENWRTGMGRRWIGRLPENWRTETTNWDMGWDTWANLRVGGSGERVNGMQAAAMVVATAKDGIGPKARGDGKQIGHLVDGLACWAGGRWGLLNVDAICRVHGIARGRANGVQRAGNPCAPNCLSSPKELNGVPPESAGTPMSTPVGWQPPSV